MQFARGPRTEDLCAIASDPQTVLLSPAAGADGPPPSRTIGVKPDAVLVNTRERVRMMTCGACGRPTHPETSACSEALGMHVCFDCIRRLRKAAWAETLRIIDERLARLPLPTLETEPVGDAMICDVCDHPTRPATYSEALGMVACVDCIQQNEQLCADLRNNLGIFFDGDIVRVGNRLWRVEMEDVRRFLCGATRVVPLAGPAEAVFWFQAHKLELVTPAEQQ